MRILLIGLLSIVQSLANCQDVTSDTAYLAVKSIRSGPGSNDTRIAKLREYLDPGKIGVNDTVLALAEYETGFIFLYRLGKPDSAITHYSRSYRLRRSFNGFDTYALGQTAFSALRCALNLNLPDTAEWYFKRILEVTPANRYTARACKDMGEYYRQRGELRLSRDCIDNASALSHLLSNGDERVNLFIEEFNIYTEQEDEQALRSAINRSPSIIAYIDSLIEKGSLDSVTALNYHQNLALAHDYIGEFETAVKYNLKCTEYATDEVILGDIYNNIGKLYIDQRAFADARKYLSRAEDIYRKNTLFRELAGIYDNYGSIYFYEGHYDESIKYCDSAIAMVINININDINFQDSLLKHALTAPMEMKYELMYFIPDKARALSGMYQRGHDQASIDLALNLLSTADAMYDHVRQQLGHDKSHIEWRKKARTLYERAVALAMDAGYPERALHFSERGKAHLIVESMRRNEMKALLPDSLLQKIEVLSKRIDSLNYSILSHDAGTSVVPAEQALLTAHQTLNELKRQVCVIAPQFCESVYDQKTPEVDDVQNVLAQDQSLLSYFLTPDTVLCLRIDKSGQPRWSSLGPRDTLDQLIDEYQDLWKYDVVSISDREFQYHQEKTARILHSLYTFLIEPLGQLPGRLVIIPDENLHALNFDMLLKEEPAAGLHPSKFAYFVKDHACTYGHSIATWMRMGEKAPTGKDLVAYVPEFEGTTFSALAFSKSILPELNRQFKFHERFGPQANRTNLGADLKKAIIHFETHAVLNDSTSYFSFLLLNKPDGTLDTFFLQDAYHLDLPGNIVAIPNCETHRGNLARGEGVISLARAFTYAGASSIITSLWLVKEQPSARIMNWFYDNMSSGMPKDIALQQAKIRYLDESRNAMQAHPYVWASLIHIGNNEPVKGRNRLPLIIAAGALLAGAGALTYRRWSTKRQRAKRAA